MFSVCYTYACFKSVYKAPSERNPLNQIVISGPDQFSFAPLQSPVLGLPRVAQKGMF